MTMRVKSERERFVLRPDSQKIADSLNRIRANVCTHGDEPCYAVCGVRLRPTPRRGPEWFPIPESERRAWLETQD